MVVIVKVCFDIRRESFWQSEIRKFNHDPIVSLSRSFVYFFRFVLLTVLLLFILFHTKSILSTWIFGDYWWIGYFKGDTLVTLPIRFLRKNIICSSRVLRFSKKRKNTNIHNIIVSRQVFTSNRLFVHGQKLWKE